MNAHRYWRLNILTTQGGSTRVGVCELELAATPGGANLSVTEGGTASASSAFSGYPASSAFDGNVGTVWAGGTGSTPEWVAWDFGAGNDKSITEIRVNFQAGGFGLGATTILATGTLDWSDDGATWTTLMPVTNGIPAFGTYTFSYVFATAAIVCPSPSLTSYSGGYMAAVSPMQTLLCHGGGFSHVAAPSPKLASASGAQAPNLTPPGPTLLSVGHGSAGEQAAFLTAPSPNLAITTGANAKLSAPGPTLVATGTVTGLAKVALKPPAPTLVSAGKVSGMATAALSAPSPNLIGYSGAVCSITLTGKASVQATGTTGGVASVAVTCPLFELTSSGTAQNHGGANLLAPSPKLGGQAQAWIAPPMARLTAIGTAVVTATYEAYAVNLKHTPRTNEQPIDEVTRYTNFPFTHVVRYQNSYYGVNETGLYLLEGTTDDSAPIPWAVKTAMTDFKSPTKKTLASAYFGGRFGPASTVQLHAGEQAPNTYSYSTPRDALAQNHRQAFGRGLRERYYALGVSGTGTLELDSIELDIHNTTRRI